METNADLDQMLTDSVTWLRQNRTARRQAMFADLARQALGRS
jgi:hypothetical protein